LRLESPPSHGSLLIFGPPRGFWFQTDRRPRVSKTPMGFNLEDQTPGENSKSAKTHGREAIQAETPLE